MKVGCQWTCEITLAGSETRDTTARPARGKAQFVEQALSLTGDEEDAKFMAKPHSGSPADSALGKERWMKCNAPWSSPRGQSWTPAEGPDVL